MEQPKRTPVRKTTISWMTLVEAIGRTEQARLQIEHRMAAPVCHLTGRVLTEDDMARKAEVLQMMASVMKGGE